MRTAVHAVIGVLAGAAILTGCTQTVTGSAIRTSHTELGANLFNPCTQLPDDVIAQVGLDPATKRVVTDAPTGPVDARICAWQVPGKPYRVDVLSLVYTIDKIRENTALTDFHDVTIGPRRSMESRSIHSRPGEDCYISMQAEQGMFEVSIAWRSTAQITEDTCALAIRYAVALEPHLPK